MRVSAQSFRGAATDDSVFARQQCPVVATVCPALLIKFFTQNLPVTIAWDEKLRCSKLPLRNFWVLWFYLFFLYFCCLPIFSSGRSVTQFLSLLKLLFLLFLLLIYWYTSCYLCFSITWAWAWHPGWTLPRSRHSGRPGHHTPALRQTAAQTACGSIHI